MSINVQQGKCFSVSLRSSVGSTPLAWCLAEMPKEVLFYHQENICASFGGTEQRFYFIARKDAGAKEVELKFIQVDCMTAEETDSVSIPVTILASDNNADSVNFLEFDGDSATYPASKPAVDYALQCSAPDLRTRIPFVAYGVLPFRFGADLSSPRMAYQVLPNSAFQNGAADCCDPACCPDGRSWGTGGLYGWNPSGGRWGMSCPPQDGSANCCGPVNSPDQSSWGTGGLYGWNPSGGRWGMSCPPQNGSSDCCGPVNSPDQSAWGTGGLYGWNPSGGRWGMSCPPQDGSADCCGPVNSLDQRAWGTEGLYGWNPTRRRGW